MFKSFVAAVSLICGMASTFIFADCCLDCNQTVDISIGWRQDDIKWKLKRIDSPYYYSEYVNSHINFEDINMYTINGEITWLGSEYYIRLKGDYGTTFKGRAHEDFLIKSPILCYPVRVHTSDPIKRRSEVYDFNGAVGYPLLFFCDRLSVIPLIGFAFNRQHLSVKGPEHSDSWSGSFIGPNGKKKHLKVSKRAKMLRRQIDVDGFIFQDNQLKDLLLSSDREFKLYNLSSLSEPPHSSFSVDSSSNPFVKDFSSNPFASPSESGIASHLGLSNGHRTSAYRFTWYGFYLGADIAYSLDCYWTLFAELEAHFLDRCHRKRKSWTGVYFIDDFHNEGWACGFNGVFGLTYAIANCWYTTLSVDYQSWSSHAKHDNVDWDTVGAKIGIGYVY